MTTKEIQAKRSVKYDERYCAMKDDKVVLTDASVFLEGRLFHFPTSYRGEYKIPDSVKIIESCAFKGATLDKLIIPDTVKNIRSYAFMDSTINYFIMPHKLSHVGRGLFSRCKGVNIIVPKGCKKLWHSDEYYKIWNYESQYLTLWWAPSRVCEEGEQIQTTLNPDILCK